MSKKLIQKILGMLICLLITIGIFQINAAAAEPGNNSISQVEINISVPFDGNDGSYLYDLDDPTISDGLNIGDYEWYLNGELMTTFDTFYFGKTYTLKMRLHSLPANLDEQVAITVNGQPAVIKEWDNNSILISWDYTVRFESGWYGVTFDSKGGSDVSLQKVDEGKTIEQLATPIKDGHVFAGWFLDESFTIPFTKDSIVNSNLTVYAKWIEENTKFTITFESNGGTPIAPIEVTVGSTIPSLAAPEKQNAIFLGWFTDADMTMFLRNDTCIFDHMTLYAKWSHSYSVIVTNGENVSDNDGLEVLAYLANLGVLTLDLNTQQVFDLEGKLLFTINNEGNIIFGEDVSSADNFIYQFTEDQQAQISYVYYEVRVSFVSGNEEIYTIYFDSKGGSSVDTQYVTEGQMILVPTAPTKPGYTFEGWYEDSECTIGYRFQKFPVESDMTLYAKWAPLNNVVTFHTNGGSLINTQTVPSGNLVGLSSDPVKEGFVFVGWFSDSDFTSPFNAAEPVTSDMDLYARWSKIITTPIKDGNNMNTLSSEQTDVLEYLTYKGLISLDQNTYEVHNADKSKLLFKIDPNTGSITLGKNVSSADNIEYRLTTAELEEANYYVGLIRVTFTQTVKNISTCTIALSSSSYTYDGKAKTPSVTVKNANGTKLTKDKDYTISYASGRTNAGTYKVTVTMKGNYTGSKTLSFKIHPIDISKCSLSLSASSYTYDGKVKTPSVTVKNANGTKLTKDKDYTISYASGRTKIGRYKVVVTLKGNYTGSKTLYFTIGPKNPSSVKAVLYGYDDVKLSWSKVSGATGYKVYYKKSSDSKYTLLTTTTATSCKKSNLADGVKYDFKVAAYKTVSGNPCLNAGKTASIYTLKKVTNVKAAKSSGDKIKVSWTNISGESGYQISKSSSKSKTGTITTYKTTSGTSKTLSATKGKTYYYKVRAYKTVDGKQIYGPWSEVVKCKR